jgi:hypothetical protein
VGSAAHLDIEIKGSRVEPAVLDVLTHYPNTRWAISCFDWQTLRNVRRLDPQAELWPLSQRVDADLIAVATELGSPTVALAAGAYAAESAGTLRDAGCAS